jgi:hypothetical protein
VSELFHVVELGVDATDEDLVQQMRYMDQFRKTGCSTSAA